MSKNENPNNGLHQQALKYYFESVLKAAKTSQSRDRPTYLTWVCKQYNL